MMGYFDRYIPCPNIYGVLYSISSSWPLYKRLLGAIVDNSVACYLPRAAES